MTFRCQLCGRPLGGTTQCTLKVPDDMLSLVPSHCRRCHWEARAVAERTFTGPILPPPWAESFRERPGEWPEASGEPLPDPDRD